MQCLKAHALAVFVAVFSSAGHIGKAVDHARSVHAAPFAGAPVVLIEKILHGKAGAGGADEIAAAAGDAALVVLVPEGACEHFVGIDGVA